MGKVCIACGAVPQPPKKPVNQPEDCPNCGGKETVREQKPAPRPEEKKK